MSGFAKYPLRYAALGLLQPGPKHGYGLYQDFSTLFASIWKAGQAKFYVLLNTLEDEGYLGSTREAQAGRPDRKVYHLEESGRQAFAEWVYAPVTSMRSIRVELVAKLRFFDVLDLPDVDRLIDAQIAVLHAMTGEWEGDSPEGDPFFALVDDFRVRQAQFTQEWLEHCRAWMKAR
ncbi:MAG: PadR family transcriptional regulator [Chloroflexi bacterium]|nr:PadR family transcriptional regulator [Chloroflexota bacterium]